MTWWEIILLIGCLYVIFESVFYTFFGEFFVELILETRYNNSAEGWFVYNVERARKRVKQNVAALIEGIRCGEVHAIAGRSEIDVLKYFALCDHPEIVVASSTDYEIAVMTGYVKFYFVAKYMNGWYRLSGVEERNLDVLMLDWVVHKKNMASFRRAVMKWHDEERRIAPKIKRHNL